MKTRPPCFGKFAPIPLCLRCGVRCACAESQDGPVFGLLKPQPRKQATSQVGLPFIRERD